LILLGLGILVLVVTLIWFLRASARVERTPGRRIGERNYIEPPERPIQLAKGWERVQWKDGRYQKREG
jgi:hypothetical protein